jgi:hypothetical protein
MHRQDLIIDKLHPLSHYYRIVLHLPSKATDTERISLEAISFIYQNFD